MSEVFFEELKILRPNYNLYIGSATHGAQAGRMLEAIERPRPEGKRGTEFGKGDAAVKIVNLISNSR